MDVQLRQVELAHITDGTNYRRNLEVDDEFIDSVRQYGVLQPVLLAQETDTAGYLLVAGHRRVAAARACKHAQIPAIVIRGAAEATHYAALAVIENGQRRDPTPVEEAGVLESMLQRGLTVQDIAAKLSRSPRYVARRLSLLRLRAPTLKLLADGKIALDHALLIARLGLSAEDEQKACSLVRPDYADQAVSVKAAAAVLATAFLRSLSDAPFPTAQDFGAPAGACSKCPKRTGQQAELFSDIKVKNVCPDSVCWRRKTDSHWATIRARYAGKIIEDAEAVGMFTGGQLVDARYVDLDALDDDGKPNREAVAFEEDAVRYVRDPLGRVHPVVKRQRQAPPASATVAKPERRDGPKGPSRKQYEIAGEFLITRLLEFFDIHDEEVHAWACSSLLLTASRPTLKRLLLRRGVEVGAESSAKDLVSALYHRIDQSGQPGEPVEDVAKILLEVLFTEAVLDDPDGKFPPRLMQLAAVQGLPSEPELLKEAEEAMRAAKAQGRRHYDA